MTGPTPYVLFPGTAAEALTTYADIFGGDTMLVTNAEMHRTDCPPEAVGHGQLTGGPVGLFAADAAGDERTVRTDGLMLALLGTAEPEVMRGWFARLSEGGEVVDDLQRRPWGDWDGQVRDRHGLHWLIGFQPGD